MIISIDLSLRSSGLCAIDESGSLESFCLVKSQNKANKKNIPVLQDEELLIYNSSEIVSFINIVKAQNVIEGIVIEGLSFGSISGSKDIVQGNFWVVRTTLYKKFKDIPIGIVPVTSWRSKVLNKQDKADAKQIYGKDYLKKAVVDKLPEDVKLRFLAYIKRNKFEKDSLYDLADSYFLGKYRIGLKD